LGAVVSEATPLEGLFEIMNSKTYDRSSDSDDTRIKNPFHDPLVTELIENPSLYRAMFSERILVGGTLDVFQPGNAILVGPQGSGKSMILNLLRWPVLAEWIGPDGQPPAPLKNLPRFLGLSVNLVQASFHAFGRRSFARAHKIAREDAVAVDGACAADFLNHFLLREFLLALKFLRADKGARLRRWLELKEDALHSEECVANFAQSAAWFGYYSDCHTLSELIAKCETRLGIWRSFLNANIDIIPDDVWKTKSTLGQPIHEMGNLLNSISNGKPHLFIVIDQYEVLPELNLLFGSTLQRIVNTLIKSRDPAAFYKIGARTYDWGKELRVWGAESRIEIQRDYVWINMADVLMRDEDPKGWLFKKFALDVALKRLQVNGAFGTVTAEQVSEIFGRRNLEEESELYFRRNSTKRLSVVKSVPTDIRHEIIRICRTDSVLELRLASAWALEQLQNDVNPNVILESLHERPWRKQWWWKERPNVALLQIARIANQRKFYYGWDTVIGLSGGNISAFLLLCSEIWDFATKLGYHPMKSQPLLPGVQTDGILVASEKWRSRDRNEQGGGRLRYEVLTRLGSAIHDYLIRDLGISNPGHSGFSLKDTGLSANEKAKRVRQFIEEAVNWSIFEERVHKPKSGGPMRRKWYLHPLFSPAFAIPYIRAKEPLYVEVETVYDWIFTDNPVKFGVRRSRKRKRTDNDKFLF
jgi:hypothetical protein